MLDLVIIYIIMHFMVTLVCGIISSEKYLKTLSDEEFFSFEDNNTYLQMLFFRFRAGNSYGKYLTPLLFGTAYLIYA